MPDSTLSIGTGPLGGMGVPKVNPSLAGGNFSLPSVAPPTTNPYSAFSGAGGSSQLSVGAGLSGLGGGQTIPAQIQSGLSIAGNGNVYPSYLTDFYNSLKTKPTTPVSTVGTNLSYGANANASTGETTTQINPDGSSNIVDSHGNNLSGTNFSIGGSPNSQPNANYTVGSDNLNNGVSSADVNNALALHQQYVQQLAAASGYSPAYQAAYQASQAAQANDAMIANQINKTPAAVGYGQTLGNLQETISQARTGNAAQETAANIALNTQQLARQGDIAAATALVEGTAPQSVSPGSSLVSPYSGQSVYGGMGAYNDVQATQSFYNLANQFPDANGGKGITWNPSLSIQQNFTAAQQQAPTAPSFQQRAMVLLPSPGGGISAYNKNQIITNTTTGQSILVSPNDATTINSASSAVKNLTSQQSSIQSGISQADNVFPQMLSLMQKAKINDFGSPIANQMQQAFNNKLIGSGDMASFNALSTSLLTIYSGIIGARGNGGVTNQVRDEAGQIINNTISYGAMQDLYKNLKLESQGVLDGINSTISQYNKQISDVASKGQPMSGQGGGTAQTGTGTTPTSWGSI